MATKESVPKEITKLFEKQKEKKKLTKNQKTKLFYWIIDMKKSSDFDLKNFVKNEFGYDDTDYTRLWAKLNRFEKNLEVTSKKQLKKRESEAFADFIDNIWLEAKSIATDTLQRWYSRAIEFGYFDEENESVRMKEFLEDALNFYVENRETIKSNTQKMLDYKAACTAFAEISKPNMVRIMALRSYTEFTKLVTILAARGIPVPEAIIIDVKNTINKALLSTHPAMKERTKT
jgi:hypothetical protein